MSTLRQDLRSAGRQARRAPGVTVLILLSIALGIGSCTTLFCLVWALVLRPLPFGAPQDLVGINSLPLVQRGEPDPVNHMSSPDYRDLRTQNRSFAAVEPYTDDFHLVLTGADPRRVSGTLVSAGLFELLGVRPLLGRQISEEDDRRGAQRVLLLGYDLWRSRFGGDPAILGKVIRANTSQYRVIGVMPPGFAFPGANEAWAAMEPERPYAANRSVRRLYVIARLRPGVSAAAARGDLAAIAARLAALDPADAGWTLAAVPLRPWLLGGDLQRSALAILAAVLSVLLIACANISSLLLAQGMKRRREMALRAALGAGPRRLVRQILTESLALAGLGGALGIPLGIAGLHVLRGALPPLPYGFELTSDPPALGAACALTLAAGLLCGLAPALRASRPDMSAVFRHAAAGDSRGHRRLHAVLVVAEVALSALLLIAASLSIRSLAALRAEEAGAAPQRLLTAWTTFSTARYLDPAARADGLRTIVERLGATPGIESAAATNFVPLAVINGLFGRINSEGAEGTGTAGSGGQRALCNAVTSAFFDTWGMPLVAGRDLTIEEGSTRSSAAVISAALARRLWPREPVARAVGKRFSIAGGLALNDLTVVGVAGNFKIGNLREEARPQVFVAAPYNTLPQTALVLRTRLPPAEALAALRRAVHGFDPDLPLFNAATMEEVSAAQLRTERLSSGSLALFGAVALLFAATGTYALLAAGVSRRRREIAVRLALGAPRGRLFRRLVGQGIGLALLGLSLGLLLAAVASRALAARLYGVTASDPFSLAGVFFLLLDVAFAACYLPARRALEVDPAEALRAE